MIKRIVIVLTLLLSAFVLQTAVRIEILNFEAGSYLPRSDRHADGTLADGKWRLSPDNTPRDQLRGVVETYGLLQYILAPLLLFFSIMALLNSIRPWMKISATFSMAVAGVGIILMFYREYYSSLGF